MLSHACWSGVRPTVPVISVNGGGPAGGGVPGCVSRNAFACASVLPVLILKSAASCTCVPWFEMSTSPLPVNPAGSVNEKSPRMIVADDFGAVLIELLAGATWNSSNIPFAACGLPSAPGMKHATAYRPGSSFTVAVTDLPGATLLGPPTNTVLGCIAPMLVV